jgi:hypothetical protein
MVRGKAMSASSKDELEKLKKLRAELESELAAKWKHRTPFEFEAEVRREKVAIQELKAELDRVNDRAAKANPERMELEDKLKSTKALATSRDIQKSGAKINVGELEDKLKSTKALATSRDIQKSGGETKDEMDRPETDEQTRIIWKKNERKPESDETPEEKQKKKRRFF